MALLRVRHGVTRRVFLAFGYALKVPQTKHGWQMFLQGLICNMQEVTLWKTRDRRLAPVLWRIRGGFAVLMPECAEMSIAEWEGFNAEAFCSDGWQLPLDAKPMNFGRLNGRVVLLDYGS